MSLPIPCSSHRSLSGTRDWSGEYGGLFADTVPSVTGNLSGMGIFDLYAAVWIPLEDDASMFGSLDLLLDRRQDAFFFRDIQAAQQIPQVGRMEIRIGLLNAMQALEILGLDRSQRPAPGVPAALRYPLVPSAHWAGHRLGDTAGQR